MHDHGWLRAMLSALRSVAAQREPAAVAVIVRELLLNFGADRARCLFYDPESGTLWSAEGGDLADSAEHTGLVGIAAASGQACGLDRVDDDPRLVRELDDPQGQRGARLLVQPVAEPGAEVHAVLVVARDAKAEAFEDADRRRMADFARRLAPLLDQISLLAQLDADTEITQPQPSLDPGPYRPEALAAYARYRQQGDVVHEQSPWIGWSYRLLILLTVIGCVYLWVGEVGDYAIGPAIVRLGGRIELTAVADGSVVELLAEPGDEVVEGQPLVRLHDADDAAELGRLELELEFELRQLLHNPTDPEARRAVAGLRGEQQRAQVKIQEHVLRAPQSGIVHDIRAQVGQAVQPGDVLLWVSHEELKPQVVALIPGDERPRLRFGMPLRLRIDGYIDAPQSLVVEHIDDDVVSPAEARRLLGPAVGEGLDLQGPVVIVRADLPPEGFESKNQHYRYHDGMRGRAEVRVRSTTIIEALIPAMERL